MKATNMSTLVPFSGSWTTPFLFLSTFIVLVILFVKRTKFLYSLRNVPSPIALPIIGNAVQLNCSLEEFFKKLLEWGKQFGDIYLLWLGPRPLVFVYRVEGVQPLLSSSIHIEKSLEYQYLKPWLGDGLVNSTGNQWHFLRKLLTPAFHSVMQQQYLKSVAHESATMVSCLKAEVNNVFNVVPYAKRAALDMICECSMGYHLNAQQNYQNDYVIAVEKMTEIIQTRFTNIWISLDPIFRLTSLGKEHENALNVIHSFVDSVITERKTQWKSNHDDNFNNPMNTRQQPLLDLLLKYSQNDLGLTDIDIRDQVNTFMFAGHDTTATSISWVLYCLGRHPEYQEKILDEFEAVIGSEELTLDNLSKLTWLEACIKETWRLYPVVPLIARQIYHPIRLMNNDIPIGSTVLINVFMLHRDPRHFPDPEEFKPERFLPENPKPQSFTYIPFSAGSRNCIGWKFGTMVVKASILTLLRAYKIEALDSTDQLRLISSVVLINRDGIRLKISPRESKILKPKLDESISNDCEQLPECVKTKDD
ncbi:cytochrome P450 4c3-like [Chelonus insularis]|uniref:cytochrome P450 4c3-like n=1 Tax=Chelonus insularis TaxID=460826 RepID=UPI00158DB5EC|nr:cytochrome P450 4c3-like [Chelonus insularis]